MKTTIKRDTIIYGLILAGAFVSQTLPKVLKITWGSGLATLIWLYLYLELVCRFRKKKEILITGVTFVLGYYLRFTGAIGNAWIDLVLFGLFGLILYGVYSLSATIMNRKNHFLTTLVFPTVWMLAYVMATLLRLPALVRIDMMFTDMNVLLQAEKVIGSFGFSFVILWMVALMRYATATRHNRYVLISGGLFIALVLPGIVSLMPNISAEASLRVAYTTGPYVGDFMDYEVLPYENYEDSLEHAVSKAAAEKAEILVFSEESFELADTDEARFVDHASELAADYELAMLIGFDIEDTDNSEDGKAINKLVFIGPDGQVLGDYQKSRLLPILEANYEAGDGQIPSHELELGGKQVKLSYLICYDSNFPAYVGQVEADTDILFLPSWDWSSVTDLHSRLCSAIAAENGLSILKPTYDGITIAVDQDGRIFYEASTDDTGYEVVEIVEMPIESTDVVVTTPTSLPPLIYATIGTEILSALICLILLVANIVVNREKTKKSLLFGAMVATNALACLSDAISWILDGRARLGPVIYGTTIISMILTFSLLWEFIAYLTEYIRERRNLSSVPLVVSGVYAVVATVLTIIASYTGQLFTIVDGVYADGPLYSGYVIINIGSMVVGLIIITIYRRYLAFYDKVVAYVYMLIPIMSAMMNVVVEEWSFAYPASTLSLVLVYVMIQSDRVERIENEGQMVRHFALHDDLTGLYNRRAFRARLEALKMKGVPVASFSAILTASNTPMIISAMRPATACWCSMPSFSTAFSAAMRSTASAATSSSV